MKKILKHHTKNLVDYCHAEEEIPQGLIYDFRDWITDTRQEGIYIVGQDHICYTPKQIKEYLQIMNIPSEEIIEDYGEREIKRQVHGLSKWVIKD